MCLNTSFASVATILSFHYHSLLPISGLSPASAIVSCLALLHDKKELYRKAVVWPEHYAEQGRLGCTVTTVNDRLGLGIQLTHAAFCASLQNVTLSKLMPRAPEHSPLEQQLFLESPK